MSLWSRAYLVPAAALCVAAWGQGRISAVEVTPVDKGLDIAVVGSKLEKPKEIRLLNGTSFIAEFDANLDIKGFRRRVSSAGIQFVEVGWYSARPPRVRVHVRLEPSLGALVEQAEGRWLIHVREQAALAAAAFNPLPPSSGQGASGSFPATVPPLNPLPKTAAAPKPAAPKGAEANPAGIKGDKGAVKAGDSGLKPEDRTSAPPSPQPAPILPKPAAGGQKPPAMPVRTTSERKINLEFVGADVVQVLRALSQEAGVNIVTAPDVSPSDKPSRITVALKGVTVSDALTYVTVIANLRYAKLNNTFFVTKIENFAPTMREFYRGDASRFATRVVSVPSGEGVQVRSAVLAAYPQDGEDGFFDILEPDTTSYASPAKTAAPAGDQTAGKDAPKTPDPLSAFLGASPMGGAYGQALLNQKPEKVKVSYLMLVGDPRRLDVIESAIRDLDARISRSFSLSQVEDSGAETVPILSGQTKQIREMLEKLLAGNPRKGSFTLSESNLRELSEGDLTTNVILMIGPKSDLKVLKEYAMVLDENLCKTAGIAYSREPDDLTRTYEVIDLKYIEPSYAAFDLKNRIRGLYVTTLPDPATPYLAGEQRDEKTDQTRNPGSGAQTETAKKDELKKPMGGEPLKLIVRGTRQQIEEARQYIALVDVPPRQAAFEMRVLEMTREEAQTLGIDWSILSGGRLTTIKNVDGTSVRGTQQGSFKTKNDVISYLATLDKMDDGRRILSRPNALLSDSKPWKMFVGDTIRYIETIQSTQNGITITTNSIDVGVTVNLAGRFGADGSIALDVEQIYSILNSFTTVPGGGQLPQTSDRKVRSTINMKAGDVLAFGGLIQEITRRQVSGVPILMDLPILGNLFKKTVHSKDKTELVFILAAMDVTPENRSSIASPRHNEIITPDPNALYKNDEIRNGKP